MAENKTITPQPPADYTPSLGNYTPLQPFRFWCQKVMPLVYDESLSYYELLCKVVDYLNKTMEDVDTLQQDVVNLHDAFVNLQDYVNNYFDTLDVQEEINNKLDSMVEDGTLDEIVSRVSNTSCLNMQRVFRVRSNSSDPIGQGCFYTGSTFLLSGSSGENQRITEVNMVGNIVRVKDYTDSHIGHANGIAKLGDYIYVVNGVGGSDITQISYSDLSVTNYYSQTSYDSVYGISAYNNKLYVLASKGSITYVCLFQNGTLTELTHFNQPDVYTSFNLIKQGFCVINNYAYIVYNYNNNILKLNINTGDIVEILVPPAGDGFFPLGELETPVNVGGQLYLQSVLYLGTSSRTKAFTQIFKTNIGGICVSNGNYGQSFINTRTLLVKPDANSNNPDGINNAFYDIEEACCVYSYLHNNPSLGVNAITMTAGTYDTEESVFMNSVSGVFNFGSSKLKYVGFYSSNCCIRGGISKTLFLNGNYTVYGVKTENGSFREGHIHITGGEITNASFIRCSVTLSQRPVITNLTTENNNFIELNGVFLVGNASVSIGTPVTVNMSNWFWNELIADTTIDKTIYVDVSGGNYGFRRIFGRLTSAQIKDLLNGNSATTNMQVVIMGDELYVAQIKCVISNTNIVFSMEKCVNYAGVENNNVTCGITDIGIDNH